MPSRPHSTHRTWMILSLTILLGSLVLGQAVSGQTRNPPRLHNGAYRVYYDTQERLNALAVEFDIWEVNSEAGYAVMALSASDATRLTAGGYILQPAAPPVTLSLLGPPGYTCYRNVDDLYADLGQIAADYPTLSEMIDYGDSWHKVTPGDEPGYDLWALKITNEQIGTPKPRFFLMANIHARELTTPETAMYFVERLLEDYGDDPDVTWIVDYVETYVVVSANPDGRLIVENGCYQRKNSNDDAGSCNVCDPWGFDHYGVDLNRNNPYRWGGAGTDPCGQTYQGSSAASEPETDALNDLVRALFPDQRPDDDTSPAPDDATGLLISLHSYSNLVLWPWGWTHNSAPNASQLQTLGRKLALFNGYAPDQSSGLYTTTGDTTDWAYGELGIAAYTFELGEAFFQACSDLQEIRDENLGALLYAAKIARTPYLTPSGPDAQSLSVSPQQTPPGQAVQLTATIDDTRYNHSQGAEPIQNVAAAEYYVDVAPWITTTTPVSHTMAAMDGGFDAPVELVTATVDTTGLSQDRHVIFVRGQDADGNWGAFSAVFLDVVPPAYAVALTPTVTAQISDLGERVTHTLTVTNQGNVTDRYLLVVNGHTWTTTLPLTTTDPLSPLASAGVRVTVDVPLSASLGQTDTVTLSVTSQGEPTQSANSTLTTGVWRSKFYLPLLLRSY